MAIYIIILNLKKRRYTIHRQSAVDECNYCIKCGHFKKLLLSKDHDCVSQINLYRQNSLLEH